MATEIAAKTAEMTVDVAATKTPAVDITTHVTIIAKNGTAVTSIDTLTLVLVGMTTGDPQPNTTENIVATVTAVVADILNLTNTNVQIAIVADDTDPVQIHATVLIQSPKTAIMID